MAPRSTAPPQKKDNKKEIKVRPKSDTSVKSRSSTATAKVKESAVLTDSSLAVLAKVIGADKYNSLVFPMYLNVPNTDIVNVANDASDVGLRDASSNLKIEVTEKLLHLWKRYRTGAKEKDKVKDIERGLKELGKPEMADVISERHSGHQELTADDFANL